MSQDPFLWLEAIDDDKALDWVENFNEETLEKYSKSISFDSLFNKILEALDADDRIPNFGFQGGYCYNFWQDSSHVRGIWRRTALDEYRKTHPEWDVLLDIDELAQAENENWVYAGHSMLKPECDRALIFLSRGGGDATEVREFDLSKREFVEDGFFVPEAKTNISWAGRDKLLVGTDFGEGSMTDSGYPMTVREWLRNTRLEDSEEIFRGVSTDVSAFGFADHTTNFSEYYLGRAPAFFQSQLFVLRDNTMRKLNKPDSAVADIHCGRLLLTLKADWSTEQGSFKAGSLLTGLVDENVDGATKLEVVFEPDGNSILEGAAFTQSKIAVDVSSNVKSKSFVANKTTDGWTRSRVRTANDEVNETIHPVDADSSDQLLLRIQSFLTPESLSLVDATGSVEQLKQAPAFFDSSKFTTTQHWIRSKDGTRVPYFQVSEKGAKGPRPTLLYGYGGFEIPLLPQYSATVGIGWLERGGSYVVANIRGGGEFGPSWHRAALKENRHRAYNDFIGVAEDLIEREVTKAEMLGIQGGSNGGLLMGNMYTMRPDLFGAIVCQVPLLDMSRYHLMLAGASWIAEYGDPDNPDEWEFLKTYSPYHNLQDGVEYPPILITTSTRDDRVHPGHARKMAAKLRKRGLSVDYYENTSGGHAGAADNSQRARMLTLGYEFLWKTLNVT